jgi:hypothetical protein
MIGDDVMGDCHGALQAGIGTAILVQTGKYRPGDESKLLLLQSKGTGDDGDDETTIDGSSSMSLTTTTAFRICSSIVEAIDLVLKSDL